jgi:uncharacterized protein YciI
MVRPREQTQERKRAKGERDRRKRNWFSAKHYNFFATYYQTFFCIYGPFEGYDQGMKIVNVFVAALILSLMPTMFQPSSGSNPNAAQAQTSTKSWLIRLIPPRPTFAEDATPAEQAVMEQHFAYWKDLNKKGICTFGGPVLDPKGAYGMIVVRAEDQNAAVALGEGDPSVKSGLNKIEIAEIRVAFYPAVHS